MPETGKHISQSFFVHFRGKASNEKLFSRKTSSHFVLKRKFASPKVLCKDNLRGEFDFKMSSNSACMLIKKTFLIGQENDIFLSKPVRQFVSSVFAEKTSRVVTQHTHSKPVLQVFALNKKHEVHLFERTTSSPTFIYCLLRKL